MLARGFKTWWNTRLTRKGYFLTFVCTLAIVFVVAGLGVSLLVGVAIAAAAGLVLHPVFERHNWTYVKKT